MGGRLFFWVMAALAVALADYDSVGVASDHVLDVLEPLEGASVPLGSLLVRFRVRPAGIPARQDAAANGESFDAMAVDVLVDGIRSGIVRIERCRVGSAGDGCQASTSVLLAGGGGVGMEGRDEESFRTVTLLLLVPGDGASDDAKDDYDETWDVVAEASVTVDTATKKHPHSGAGINAPAEAPPHLQSRDPAAGHPAGGSKAASPVIVFDSPSWRHKSFLDPNKVVLRFHVEPGASDVGPTSHYSEVLVDGAVMAKGEASPSLEVAMPVMQARAYLLQVFLCDSRGVRTGVSAESEFFVWPDHSWVGGIEAHGDGLSEARAGAASTFLITSRDRLGNTPPPGSDSFLCRLTGPARVGCSVRHVRGGLYEASYMVAEAGAYTMDVELHYADGGGLLDYGAEGGGGNDVIAWHIKGSPFTVEVAEAEGGAGVHPYVPVPPCAGVGGGLGGGGAVLGGRWVSRRHCEERGMDCWGMVEDDDAFMWLPWRCRYRGYTREALGACAREGGGFRVLMAGSSQQRTLFFDVGKMLGTQQVQPRKYWTDLAATDVNPPLYFHWMVPGYSDDGTLDYDSVLENLAEFVGKHRRGPGDVLVVQASVHDLHLGTLEEYGGHVERVAAFLAGLDMRVIFRSGDAFHVPPASRSIVERGMRDPRMQHVNALAERAMRGKGVPYVDTHVSTVGRPDKCLDGYHYFDRFTEEVSETGEEICIGNSVARTQAQVLLNFVCSGRNSSAAKEEL